MINASTVAIALAISSPTVPTPLKPLVDEAVERNLSYLVAEADRRRALADAKVERAAFDPVLGAALTQSEQRARTVVSPGIIPGTDAFVRSQTGSVSLTQRVPLGTELTLRGTRSRSESSPFVPLYSDAAGVAVTQHLLEGFGPGADYAAARIAAAGGRAAVASAQRQLEQTVADVQNAYWELEAREDDEQVAWISYKIGEDLLRRDRELNRLNLLSNHDLLTAQAGYERRLASLLDVVRDRIDSMEALIFLVYGEAAADRIATGYTVRTTTSSVPGDIELPEREKALELALAQRADLRAARATLEQAELSEKALANAILPRLDATGSYDRGGSAATGADSARSDALRSARKGTDGAWTLGLNFSLPIGNRPDRERWRSASELSARRRLELVSLENLVRQQVLRAHRGVIFEKEHLVVALRSSDLARKQLQQEQKRMSLGLADAFRVLETEENAVLADQTANATRRDLSSAITAYKLAIGDLR